MLGFLSFQCTEDECLIPGDIWKLNRLFGWYLKLLEVAEKNNIAKHSELQ